MNSPHVPPLETLLTSDSKYGLYKLKGVSESSDDGRLVQELYSRGENPDIL